ncbi:MAG: hypothetical protein GY719_04925, partial [bacterium]|nr:hypothetical protein [bacterium]
STAFYAPAAGGLGVGGHWLTHTAQIQSAAPYGVGLQGAVVTVNGQTFTGDLILVTTDTVSLAGYGRTLTPSFADRVLIEAEAANLRISGPAGQRVGYSGYTGPITITEHTDELDRIELNGALARDLFLALAPAESSITPVETASFQAEIASNQDDTYTLTVAPPLGWQAQIDASGRITITPALDAVPGKYKVHVAAQSASPPSSGGAGGGPLFTTAIHQVTILPWQGLELSIAPDPMTTVPMGPVIAEEDAFDVNNGQVQVPGAAYIAAITNTSSNGHTFDVQVIPDGFPAEWIMLGGAGRSPTTTITLHAGRSGNLGVYVSPTGLDTLPPVGSEYPFTVHATAADDPALTQSASETFIMPPIPFAHVSAQPALVYATPGLSTTFEASVRNVGNISDTFDLDVTLPVTTWATLAPPSPLTLSPGEASAQTIRIATPSGELGRDYRVKVGTWCGPYKPSAEVTVRMVGPNALSVYRSGQEIALCLPDDAVLPLVLDFMGLSVGEVEAGCDGNLSPSTTSRDRLASAARAVANHTSGISLVTADDDPSTSSGQVLRQIAESIEAHTTCADLASDVQTLQTAVADLQAQACAIGHHGVSAVFRPGSTFTLVDHPATYTLAIRSQGTLTTTYEANLQIDAAANLQILNPQISNPFTVTIRAGDEFTVPVAVTPTIVGNHSLRADVTTVGQAAILPHTQARAALRSLDAYLDVVQVSADPAFVEYGSGTLTGLYAQIANLTQAPLTGQAQTRVWDASGTPILTGTRTLQFESALLPLQHDLITLDTTGIVTGVYTVTLEVFDTAGGDLIPRGTGWGLFAVGQAIRASSEVIP